MEGFKLENFKTKQKNAYKRKKNTKKASGNIGIGDVI